jgi:hypothetical protein
MARLLKSELDQWHEWELERLKLQRQVKDLEALQKPLKEKFLAFVQEKGGDERAVKSNGFLLKLNAKRESVSWKDEFVRVAGIDEAEAIIARQPSKDVLVIEPPSRDAA